MPKERIVVILGPTATGKSNCGIELAKRFRGEIISGDSMLVYRQMNIGTAKPSAEELQMAPHHLVDILPPDASYSVADFQQQAAELISQITLRGNLPILVGGTGLYIKALLEDYQFSSVEENPELRRQLEIFLSMDRDFLYERINQRVDRMLEEGLEEEVRALLKAGVPTDCLSMKSLGYRQMAEYLTGKCDFAAAVDNIKKGTRHFAKRQITWYKKMPYIHWFTVDRNLNYEKIVTEMADILEKKVKRM